MYEFDYHRPSTAEEAVRLMAAASDGKYVSGGMTLIPTLKQRLAQPSDLIDLGGLKNSGIEVTSGSVIIKAGTIHESVATSTDVKQAIPALAELASLIGDPHVRHRGTIGGSVANNDPAADYPAACLALGGTIHTNSRQIAAAEFFTGMFETALDEGEIITAVSFPIPEKAGYVKFRNPASRYAMVGVFVAKTPGAVRVAVTGAGASVFRVVEMENALSSNFSPMALQAVSVSADGLNSDIHASAEYRAHLVGVMARRAVERATG
ncbi:carbon-monoxide dehydrogenase medium subunit [Rhodoligotrophos appendicifer]|uniref:FAD binding domain-containing protein n=1 Tax=Rhodoligotrophos appendicifer TaxID=987056 RepID=UPI0011865251|nr:xanthine dehydrogenase family protein subunit M [Rhodoligotrophos appendicifer]